MSLPVPLAVRVGDKHVTLEVQSLSFRKEAVGGVRSISFSLARSLANLNGLDPLAKVYVYDTRTGMCVAQGRFADPGRGADANGQRWDCVAFGPAQHASDITNPLIYVDLSLDGWLFERIDLAGAGATFDAGAVPGSAAGNQGLLCSWDDGTVVQLGSLIAIRYARAHEAGMKLGWFAYNYGTGITDATWKLDAVVSTDGNWGAADTITVTSWSTLGGTNQATVVTGFVNGRNVLDFRTYWTGGVATVTGAGTWAHMTPQVAGLRFNKAGAEVTTGYGSSVLANQVVEDLLGRMLPEFDGPNAVVATNSFPINQLVYSDGVNAAQVLEDLMGMEPAYRWYTTPDLTGGGYGFRWDLWPTAVRYEATLQDGGSFPISTQSLYNRVMVRWRDTAGRTKTTERSMACAILDGTTPPLIRKTTIDLGSEAGTLAQAQQAGDAFLTEHNVPKNSGTLTVSRPIRDVTTGAMVDPWEIEAGELVRILGVEAYPDAFNASTNDGQGVFRIHAVDYTSDGNTATLALDSDARDTEDALVALISQRKRR